MQVCGKAKKWYSHKFKGPGIRYEIGIAIQTGDLCHLAGPFPPGKYNDLQIFRMRLKQKLIKDNRFCKEKVEADDGYLGEPLWICLPGELGGGGERQRTAKGLARNRQETIKNRRFKQWGVLRERYRHDLKMHGTIVRAIAAVIQIDMRSGNPPFQVEYRTQETRGEMRFRKNILKVMRRSRKANQNQNNNSST